MTTPLFACTYVFQMIGIAGLIRALLGTLQSFPTGFQDGRRTIGACLQNVNGTRVFYSSS